MQGESRQAARSGFYSYFVRLVGRAASQHVDGSTYQAFSRPHLREVRASDLGIQRATFRIGMAYRLSTRRISNLEESQRDSACRHQAIADILRCRRNGVRRYGLSRHDYCERERSLFEHYTGQSSFWQLHQRSAGNHWYRKW